jgi:very-short-patch-repair endonuclease
VAESHVLRLLAAWGLPAPECQHVIRDGRGRFVAKVDFAWPRWRLVLEYDGDEVHTPRDWEADDDRQGRIEALGWRVERADRGDLRPSSSRLCALLTSLLTQPA